jgi:hypothetical protein
MCPPIDNPNKNTLGECGSCLPMESRPLPLHKQLLMTSSMAAADDIMPDE